MTATRRTTPDTVPGRAPARPDVAGLDPYAFLAVLGKRVIHPGGRRATEELSASPTSPPGRRCWTSAAASVPPRSRWPAGSARR